MRTETKYQINLSRPGWSLLNARAGACWSKLAYETFSIHDRWSDASVLVQDHGECIVIAFRGTKEPRDFVTDVECELTASRWGRVHHGFLEAWESLSAQLGHKLHLMPRKPIFVFGHSLGGALALLCALDLDDNGREVAGIYTYGQPRTGDKIFAQLASRKLKSRYFRVVNMDDPVPMVPPLRWGYRAAGDFIFLPHLLTLKRNPSFLGVATINAIGVLQAWRHGSLALLPNHHIDLYVSKLKHLPIQ